MQMNELAKLLAALFAKSHSPQWLQALGVTVHVKGHLLTAHSLVHAEMAIQLQTQKLPTRSI